jgi:hypothetical protein
MNSFSGYIKNEYSYGEEFTTLCLLLTDSNIPFHRRSIKDYVGQWNPELLDLNWIGKAKGNIQKLPLIKNPTWVIPGRRSVGSAGIGKGDLLD